MKSEPLTSNLVARLRRRAITQRAVDPVVDELLEAADTIERLTRELDDRRHLTSGIIEEKDRLRAEVGGLKANARAATGILNAIEFDGQAYDAILKACVLLAVPAYCDAPGCNAKIEGR